MEWSDGNQWHYITDPAAYAQARLLYEYRVCSGSTGQMLVDTRWVQQRAAMQPLLDGMLYYQKPYNKETPEAQATLFCDLLGHLAPNEMVMLDIEGDINVPDPADFVRRWCAVVEPRLNTLAWIYVPQSLSGVLTMAVTGNRIVKAPKYSGTDQRGPAPSWPHDVHQYSDKGAFPGGNGPGDANFTDLTVPQMLDRCRQVSAQPQGVPMLMPPRRAMWSPNCDDRPRNVTWLCFHTQEGNGTADSLARYLDNPASQVAYNTVGDAVELIDVVPFDRSPWAALGANGRADHFCFGGSFSAWSRQQWLDCGMLDNAAAWLADRATVRGIPIAYVGTDGVRTNLPGVIGHVDWTRGANEGSHTDPGPNFPWDELIARAQRLTTTTQGVDVTPDECRQAIRDVLNEQAPSRVPGSTVSVGLGDCMRNTDAAAYIALHALTDPIPSAVPGSTYSAPPAAYWANADSYGYQLAQQVPQLVSAVQALEAKFAGAGSAPVPAGDIAAELRAVLAALTLTAKVA